MSLVYELRDIYIRVYQTFTNNHALLYFLTLAMVLTTYMGNAPKILLTIYYPPSLSKSVQCSVVFQQPPIGFIYTHP